MRDALLMAVIFASLLATLRYPFVGVIVWAWFSLMTPHQLAYGVYGVPLNMVIAGVTIAALAVHGEFHRAFVHHRIDKLTLLLAAFAGWLAISQAFSLNPANSAVYFDRFFKTLIFAIVCAVAATTRLRAHALILILTLGVGFFAAKGALFTLATLGRYHVQGIELSVLEDNNHLGIAMASVLPMMLYLRGAVAKAWVKGAFTALAVLTVIAILGTQSRGAFICLVVFAGYFFMQSRHRGAFAAVALLISIPALTFMPASWHDRMATISDAGHDESFMGRVHAWQINWEFARANPVTGAGLRNPYLPELAEKVDPVLAKDAKAAHSIYFEVLGGAGFTGLAIYLALLATAYKRARRLARNGGPVFVRRFGYFTQIALAVFFVGGASTSMEMWDGYLMLIALTAAVSRMAEAAPQSRSETRAPRPLRADGLKTKRLKTGGLSISG
ncbi:MAG: putative O-glycosylation ligase, exosortase A system-associated [Parvularculaceae bacterium]|nr:putative O-glycosylation ligase, exosortase A system-associated [Parvularculaceae bacterium]